MPTPSPEEIHCFLRQTNARLSFWLGCMSPESSNAQMPVATPQQISGLLSELMGAGKRLQNLPAIKSAELEQELSQYRRNVERIRDLLPLIQRALIEQRARLEAERMRLRSAAEWLRGSRQTL